MFKLGIWELMAILIVAIVFINPKDLPKIARKIGYWYGRMKEIGKWISDPARELEGEFRKPLADLEETVRPIQEFEEEMKSEMNDITQQPGIGNWKEDLPDLNGIMPLKSYPEVEKQESDT